MIRFETFRQTSDKPLSESGQMSSALAAMQLWQSKNAVARIINVETLISEVGSSMTSAGHRKFDGFRVWYDDGETQ